MQASSSQTQEQKLKVAKDDELRKELSFADPTAIEPKEGEDPELDKKASEYVQKLIDVSENDLDAKNSSKSAIEEYGLDLQRKAAHQSKMLERPLKTMSTRSKEGGEVANALIDLKITVEDLDPAKFDFSPGWFTRMLGYVPLIGTPMKRYFSRFENAQTVINAIINSLEKGREQLARDNITLAEDQKRMRELTFKIEKAIKLGRLMDAKLSYHVERELSADDPKARFVKEELLFPLRQRIMDLQQQLAVCQQGIIAIEVIMRNNKELIRGVNRALNVTVSALEVAVTVAMALNDQRIVLDKIQALNKTTDELIKGTAERLRTQGVEIHKQAASTQINMDILKAAFEDIKMAMEDISRFRLEALPQMAGTIVEMDKLTEKAEDTIKNLEKGNRAKPSISIEV